MAGFSVVFVSNVYLLSGLKDAYFYHCCTMIIFYPDSNVSSDMKNETS